MADWNLKISEAELQRWLNVHPSQPVDAEALARYVDGEMIGGIVGRHDRKISIGLFLVQQLEQQAHAA